MSALTDALIAMKDLLLLADKVDRLGNTLTEISQELRDHDKRIIRLETFVEISLKNKQLKP